MKKANKVKVKFLRELSNINKLFNKEEVKE